MYSENELNLGNCFNRTGFTAVSLVGLDNASLDGLIKSRAELTQRGGCLIFVTGMYGRPEFAAGRGYPAALNFIVGCLLDSLTHSFFRAFNIRHNILSFL